MSMALSRTAVRSAAKLPLRRTPNPARFESTATKATEAAKDTAGKAAEISKNTASKASEATKDTAAKASETVKSTASKASETAKDTASKAAETAKEYQSKASEGLSRVTSSAGPAISNAASGVSNALGKIGGRTGRMISFVERQIPPTIYYARVGMELGRLVFKGQQMSPPPVSTFQAYFQRVIKSVRNPDALFKTAEKTAENSNPQGMMQSIRSMNREQMVSGLVLGAEVLGFFTVGEMIGRMKLIGYRGDTGAHH